MTGEDYHRYGSTGRWFNFGSRCFMPSAFQRVDAEVQRIISALLILNRTGLFSASFRYFSMLGNLEIVIYGGTEKLMSEAIFQVTLDCRYDPLRNAETDEEFSGEMFIEWLILLVQ